MQDLLPWLASKRGEARAGRQFKRETFAILLIRNNINNNRNDNFSPHYELDDLDFAQYWAYA